MLASIRCAAMDIDIHPEPVPISRIFGLTIVFISSNAMSTRRSVSGRGIKTS